MPYLTAAESFDIASTLTLFSFCLQHQFLRIVNPDYQYLRRLGVVGKEVSL